MIRGLAITLVRKFLCSVHHGENPMTNHGLSTSLASSHGETWPVQFFARPSSSKVNSAAGFPNRVLRFTSSQPIEALNFAGSNSKGGQARVLVCYQNQLGNWRRLGSFKLPIRGEVRRQDTQIKNCANPSANLLGYLNQGMRSTRAVTYIRDVDLPNSSWCEPKCMSKC